MQPNRDLWSLLVISMLFQAIWTAIIRFNKTWGRTWCKAWCPPKTRASTAWIQVNSFRRAHRTSTKISILQIPSSATTRWIHLWIWINFKTPRWFRLFCRFTSRLPLPTISQRKLGSNSHRLLSKCSTTLFNNSIITTNHSANNNSGSKAKIVNPSSLNRLQTSSKLHSTNFSINMWINNSNKMQAIPTTQHSRNLPLAFQTAHTVEPSSPHSNRMRLLEITCTINRIYRWTSISNNSSNSRAKIRQIKRRRYLKVNW